MTDSLVLPTGELSVEVGGRPLPLGPPPTCSHNATWNEQVVVAEVRADGGTGRLLERQVKLKLRCGLCGVSGRFLVETARESTSDGALGVVVVFEPVEE